MLATSWATATFDTVARPQVIVWDQEGVAHRSKHPYLVPHPGQIRFRRRLDLRNDLEWCTGHDQSYRCPFRPHGPTPRASLNAVALSRIPYGRISASRSEEHTSELQSLRH